MTAAFGRLVITEPGIYDIPDEVYHRDPVAGGSLSSTGARNLLPPHCPAEFDYWRTHQQPRKREFDLGHVAHKLILGAGAEIEVIDADSYQTKKAQQQRDAAYDRGDTPVLPAEFDAAQQMAAAIRRHPRFPELFPAHGAPEQTLVWVDETTGVWCRARLDWLHLDITDVKTTTDVSREHISKDIYNFGYHQQADFYLRGAHALDLVPADAAFLFAFVTKKPPHLVTAVELNDDALKIGHDRNDLALEIYRDCKAADVWPSHSDDIELIGLPGWAERRHYEET